MDNDTNLNGAFLKSIHEIKNQTVRYSIHLI